MLFSHSPQTIQSSISKSFLQNLPPNHLSSGMFQNSDSNQDGVSRFRTPAGHVEEVQANLLDVMALKAT